MTATGYGRAQADAAPAAADPSSEIALLRAENADLRARLEEAEETLIAIRSGDVDALVVGSDIYTLDSANAASVRLRKDVLTQMEDAVVAFDDGDHVIFMNPAAERQYRVSASAVLGCGRAALFHEDWPSPLDQSNARHALDESGAYRASSVHRLTDRSAIHVESTVSRLRDAQGRVTGSLFVIRDISERVHVESMLHDAAVALARRERQFSTIVENSPDVFARIDRDFRHLYVSPAIERLTALPADRYIGRTSAELGAAALLGPPWEGAIGQVFDSGQVGRIKLRSTLADGRERVFDARLMPEFAEDGSVESVLSIASDVTEQDEVTAALRVSQARLEFTLESARIGEWDLDFDSDIARHSLEHDRCFGYTAPVHPWGREIMLRHVHPDDRAMVAAKFQQVMDSGEDLHFECRVIWPDQSVHWIEAHGSLYLTLGGPPRLLGTVVDATQRKLAEQAMWLADRRKDEFLATLAHELRNPLAPIRNAVQMMDKSSEPSVHEAARAIIERQLRQMVHLVDDLLDVSRISQGKVELRRSHADLAQIVKAAIETSRPLIDAGGHRLATRLPPPGALMVLGDVTRLSQIVANLLNNAAKYTADGGDISIAADRDGPGAVITVQDSGVGIPPEMLPRVFDMFAQIDRTLARAQGGLGIGLALVKRLVELHGGTVEAHSAGQGQGSRFVVRLPLAGAPPTGETIDAPVEAPAPDPAGLRVLVVDDNVDSAESLAQLLGMMHCETCTAHDGVEAVRLAEAFAPDLVLLDIGLPKMNGHDAARAIRGEPWGRGMLLVALSGWGQDSDRMKSRVAGFDHHLVKPVAMDTLTELLGLARRAAAGGAGSAGRAD